MNKARFSINRTEDAQLLSSFVSDRDEIAFGRLVRKYENLVWFVCRRVLNNQCDAEDAFQATFALLATKAKRIRKPKSIASWLYGVAYRTAKSIRRQRHREHVSYQDAPDSGLADDVLEQVTRKNEIELVSAELMGLAEKYKAPLIMYYFLGESTAQIANTLGLTAVAVESRLKRGRLALKSRLLGRGLEPAGIFAAILAIPTVTVSPALTSNTIAYCLTASLGNSFLRLLASQFHIDQAGAKLMIWKSAIAFGLVAVLGMGVAMLSGGFANTKSQTVVVGQDPIPNETVSQINIVQEQDQEEGDAKEKTHAEKLHNHLHHHFFQLMLHLHGVNQKHESKKESTNELHRRHQLHSHQLHQHELHRNHKGGDK